MEERTTDNDNKRIAKNTLFMYLRMFITVCVSLYTSRIVLRTLGVEDYGLYNVIGGVIAMFGFINGAMVNTTSRFITFYLGKKDIHRLTDIFNMSFFIHAIIALVVVLLGETVGLWFLQHEMTIPETRMFAAQWLFQLSVANTALAILTVPFNAAIVAHEKMSAFAYISILDAVLKLGVVFLLVIAPFDRLIFYGTLLFMIQAMDMAIYYVYCKRRFIETKFRVFWDCGIFKEMMGLAGWSALGNFSFLFYNEGINIMLNMFCGPAVNAARGIAVQIDNVIRQFANNVQTAINPQIIKSYATDDKRRMFTLMFASSRYCFFLLYLVSLPLMLEADCVLRIWLSEYPEHTVNFIRITLLSVLLETLSSPMFTANLASGKVKVYQIVISLISYSFMPITYLILKHTLVPETAFLCVFVEGIACMLARAFIIKYQVGMSVRLYIRSVLSPITVVAALAFVLPALTHCAMSSGLLRLLAVCGVSVTTIPIIVYLCGITRGEKAFVLNKINGYIKHDN